MRFPALSTAGEPCGGPPVVCGLRGVWRRRKFLPSKHDPDNDFPAPPTTLRKAHHVPRPLPDRQLRRSPPVARHRRLDRRRRRDLRVQRHRGRSSPTRRFSLPGSESQRAADAHPGPLPAGDPLLLERDLPLRGRADRPDHQGRDRAGRDRSWPTYPHVVGASSPYDPRGPTVSEDEQTAFATVGFDVEKVDATEFDAAEKAVQDLRDAGIEVEYDGGLGYANVPRPAATAR